MRPPNYPVDQFHAFPQAVGVDAEAAATLLSGAALYLAIGVSVGCHRLEVLRERFAAALEATSRKVCFPMAIRNVDQISEAPQPAPSFGPNLCSLPSPDEGHVPPRELPPEVLWEAELARRACAAEKDALRQLHWSPVLGSLPRRDAPLGDLLVLAFFSRKTDLEHPSIVEDALLAVADEAHILGTLMEAIHRADDSVLARFADRIQARALLAIELERRIAAANPVTCASEAGPCHG